VKRKHLEASTEPSEKIAKKTEPLVKIMKKAEPLVKIVKMREPPRKPHMPKKSKKEPSMTFKIPYPKAPIEKDMIVVIPDVHVSIFISCGVEGCCGAEVNQPE
jgi:hypothetical protein